MLCVSAQPVLKKPSAQEASESAASAPAGTAIIAANAPNGAKKNDGGICQDPTVMGVWLVRSAFIKVNGRDKIPVRN